ncbi:hypothetical protein GGI14_001296 [Coemansia sp. S680]|nr:hypothetical protein GGI14_001296 [Coemansia sp. S680]
MSGGKYGQLVVISRSGADGKAFPMHTTRVVLKNLSENCTSVNTQVLEAGHQRVLKSGDVITIVGRSLRYEENKGETTTTPQGPSRAPTAPQTVAVTNGGAGGGVGGRQPVVFASGSKADGQPQRQPQRQLQRKLSRTPRNPETARKLKLWDAHYSGNRNAETTSDDIFAESPPSGLLGTSQRLLAESDDPFAASNTHEEGAFERMAQSVGRGSEVRRDPEVAAEVKRIMGQINQMAGHNNSPSRLTTPLQSGRKRPRSSTDVVGGERKRSRSLEREQQQPASASQRQLYPPLIPQKSSVGAAYGSEDETSRVTVGVSPQSTYNRSPTLQRQRQGEGGSQSVVVQRSKPIQRAGSTTTIAKTPELQRTTARFFSSLPRPINGSSSVVGRRAASNGSPTPSARMSSPLKRTLSSNSNCESVIRPPIMPLRPVAADDESEEVPTEPEPESESDAEPIAVVTPENRAAGRPLLLAQESMARKSVRFGPALSPEVFDESAPPSTPLRRGTPMQLPARASSILRRTSPTRPQPVSPSLLRSLLTPRPTRRQAMHQYIASLSALAESPLAVDQPPRAAAVVEPVEEASVEVPKETLPVVGIEPAAPIETLVDIEPATTQEPVVDIESATVLGASPADRRQRRRRSVRLAANHQQRRVTLDSPLRVPLQKDSPSSSSPSLFIVKRTTQSHPYLDSPTKRPPPAMSISAQRRERRRTAPIIGSSDFSASMAQMAAALGEDVPTLFAKKMPAAVEKVVDPMVIAPEDDATAVEEPEVAPLGLADAMQQEQQAEDDSEANTVVEETSVSPASNVVLLEQAERQARIQGTSPESSFVAGDSLSLGVSTKLAGLSVTTPPPTPITLSSSASRKHRRQTIADFAPISEVEELSSVDEILAHRQRLKRIQDRKRRRQTVADLNKRRSSWRGWMPTANPLVDSPPSSPEAHHVADWSRPVVSTDTSFLVSPPPPPPASNTLMYPPTAWNTEEEEESPTKRRRRMRGITEIVGSVLGINTKPASIELANDPKHGTREVAPATETKAFAYPPRPVPIDADWEKIDMDNGDFDNGEERLAKEEITTAEEPVAEASQQVELYAVSGPASDVDSASLFSAHLPTEQEHEQAPAAVEEPVVSTVLSPPTTRGRASRGQRQTSASVSPPPPPSTTAATRRTTIRPPPPPSTRRRAPTTPTTADVPATMTRKRRAEDPAPTTPAAIKRGRGRPPTNGIRKTPEPSVMSPPATRASKKKSHAS